MKKIMILAAALALSGCYSDKGSYDYHPLPVVTITQVADIPAYAGETLAYTPEVVYAEGDSEANYDFHWEKSMPIPDELTQQEGKVLNLNETTVARCSWTLFVTNKESGAVYSETFYFNVQAKYGRGWLLLADDSGSTTLHYIRPEYEDPTTKLVRKFVTFASAVTNLGSQPQKMWQNIGSTNPWPIKIAQGSGALSVNGGSLLKEVNLDEEFVGVAPADFKLKQYVTFGDGNCLNFVLSENGKAYVREGAGDNFVEEYANFPISYQGSPLNVDWIIDTRYYSGYFVCVGMVDTANKRVVWQNADSKLMNQRGTIVPSIMTSDSSVILADNDVFNFANFGDKELVWTDLYPQTGAGLAANFLRILYKKGGDYWIQEQYITASRGNTTQVSLLPTRNEVFKGSAMITENTVFFQPEVRDYLFFATGNTVYCYRPGTINEVHTLYTFAAGENVVSMAMNPQESELGCYLSNGSFVALNVLNANIMSAVVSGRVDNLAGTPVHMVYKFLAPYGYSQRARGGNYND